MNSVTCLEPAIDPANRITFLLDWELTLKCNLDCSYCEVGIDGGHDNSTAHPPLDDCLKTIDFMFEYADSYMSNKPSSLKYVILNVYGGEAMHHPDIVEILNVVRERHRAYSHKWNLTITTTTNLVLSNKKAQAIIPLVDEFTVSYHTEATDKQKQQIKDNLLQIKSANRRVKCVVLMHTDDVLFDDADEMIQWLKSNDISLLPRQLDMVEAGEQQFYNQRQVIWFKNLYQIKTHNASVDLPIQEGSLTNTGRSCCGGRQLCTNQQYRSRHAFVSNKFTDWYCSVNHFFLFVKQVNGDVYINKDCKMRFDGSIGPIGNLNNTQPILDFAKQKDKPTIRCAKSRCFCGLCAPKAADLNTYNTIMRKYEIPNSNLL